MTPDRRAYVEANAVALVEALEARVARQTAELSRLNQSLASVRADRDRLREALHAVWRQAHRDLARGDASYGETTRVLFNVERDARAALAAAGVQLEDRPRE